MDRLQWVQILYWMANLTLEVAWSRRQWRLKRKTSWIRRESCSFSGERSSHDGWTLGFARVELSDNALSGLGENGFDGWLIGLGARTLEQKCFEEHDF